MILVSAFEPFDCDPENSSQMVAARLGGQFKKVVLPVTFSESWSVLEAAIEKERPRLVIALGQADSRSRISLERVALNWIDARIADNEGHQPREVRIDPDGEVAIFSRVPLREICDAAVGEGVHLDLSYSAGTFVCNYLAYKLMQGEARLGYRGVFVHLPLWREQRLGQGRESVRPLPKMSLEEGVRAVEWLSQKLILS